MDGGAFHTHVDDSPREAAAAEVMVPVVFVFVARTIRRILKNRLSSILGNRLALGK